MEARTTKKHSLTDPVEHAYANGITFTEAQADWIAHHVRNGLVPLALITEKQGATPEHAELVDKVNTRLMRLVHAAELGVRE